jgi:hypothetical protein
LGGFSFSNIINYLNDYKWQVGPLYRYFDAVKLKSIPAPAGIQCRAEVGSSILLLAMKKAPLWGFLIL